MAARQRSSAAAPHHSRTMPATATAATAGSGGGAAPPAAGTGAGAVGAPGEDIGKRKNEVLSPIGIEDLEPLPAPYDKVEEEPAWKELSEEVGRVIVGQHSLVDGLLVGLLAG